MKLHIEDNPFVQSALEIKFNKELKPKIVEAGFEGYPYFNSMVWWIMFTNELEANDYSSYDEMLKAGFDIIDRKKNDFVDPTSFIKMPLVTWSKECYDRLLSSVTSSLQQENT